MRVLITHAEPIVAAGLATVLRGASGLTVSMDHKTTSEIVEGRIQVVVSDAGTGLALARERQRRTAGAARRFRILLIVPRVREHELREALTLGVEGCLLLSTSTQELIGAVRTLARGGRHMCGQAATCLADAMSREPLTTREREVLELLTLGYCNKTIATQLGIGIGTIKAHVKSIMIKLDASNRTEAVCLSARAGMVPVYE